ncbi:hypothetical protein QP168_09365 [Aerococcus urinae]|uniref:Uncharacterized protein n=1 Tax=Aerococcus mictus TaxID=2976810 RepID=A0A1E9PGT8_9LACT|nr:MULTISPECIES: hypothetical protein [Aerococcus]KAA9291221.1 hypothetical protein F6I06_06125 [Aerococcus mictus]MBU5611215.1 hypothetical protein [Aerococcus urinae]MCY3064950.1 hypothetical protein [Aerococcus mictus]MCY3077327.1 hypothetical protein [Aerococcus mictus]MCY3081426.1 hypothetical protein [Aerococcus mictus]
MKLKIDLNYHYESNISEDERIKIMEYLHDDNGMLSNDFVREIEAEFNDVTFIQDGRDEWGIIDDLTIGIDYP